MPRKTPQFRSWDDYYIPGTTVLRNKLTSATEPYGTTDPDKLRQFEERAASVRLVAAKLDPIRGSFDYNHLKAIHLALFQDVYDWAGEERTGPLSQMSKRGPDVVHYPPGDPRAPMVNYGYYPAPAIADAASLQFRRLAKQNLLRGRDREEFVAGLAEHWGEINTIHSFREGNTRTQFVFFSELARHAGYELDITQFAENRLLREEFPTRSLLQSIHHPNRPPRSGAEQGTRRGPVTVATGRSQRTRRPHAHRSSGFPGTADNNPWPEFVHTRNHAPTGEISETQTRSRARLNLSLPCWLNAESDNSPRIFPAEVLKPGEENVIRYAAQADDDSTTVKDRIAR